MDLTTSKINFVKKHLQWQIYDLRNKISTLRTERNRLVGVHGWVEPVRHLEKRIAWREHELQSKESKLNAMV